MIDLASMKLDSEWQIEPQAQPPLGGGPTTALSAGGDRHLYGQAERPILARTHGVDFTLERELSVR